MSAPVQIPASIADIFSSALATHPDAEALVTRRGRWTYRQLDEAAATAAGVLAGLGIGPGDRVAAVLPNEADIVFAFHGAMRLGAIWVGINQALATPERVYQLSDSGAAVLVCDSATAAALAPHRSELPNLRTIIDDTAWRATMATTSPLRNLPAIDPHAPAALAYTSGTTGRPKGVVHSQYNLLVPGALLVHSRGYDRTLRKGDCLPLTILNLLVLTTLLVAQAGGTTVIMDQMYAEGIAEWIERERVTVWNGPPPIVYNLSSIDAITPSALASLRDVWSGGSDVPEVLRDRFFAKFNVPVAGTYGLSEAPTVVCIDPIDGSHRAGASGKALPHLQITIIDDEICVGPTSDGPYAGLYRLPAGYWNRPEESAATFANGLLHTGDVGFVDDDGWLHVRDRKKLVIVRGGANVYPAEVERVLQSVVGVAGSAVTGVADERLGERVVAVVELDAGATTTAEAITEKCRAELAKYKVPERIVFVDRLPRNAMGKVDRVAVRGLV